MKPIRCFRNVCKNQFTLRNTPKEQRSHLHHAKSLKQRNLPVHNATPCLFATNVRSLTASGYRVKDCRTMQADSGWKVMRILRNWWFLAVTCRHPTTHTLSRHISTLLLQGQFQYSTGRGSCQRHTQWNWDRCYQHNSSNQYRVTY
jgi:hypothetical protein